ncbi:MAG TPA: tellurite resistance TerB family protein [Alphaproteobacteria bacterium]|nr:tellurite resistance TerB family protein [Alphaproteobacteria bacterium]
MNHPPAAISQHAALIYTMVLASAVDGRMPTNELGLIGRLVRQLPIFSGFDIETLTETAQECAVILQTANGLDRVLSLIAEALPPNLRETAYLVACEIAAADRRLPFEEMRLLQKLRQALELDRLIAGAIERATTVRLAIA